MQRLDFLHVLGPPDGGRIHSGARTPRRRDSLGAGSKATKIKRPVLPPLVPCAQKYDIRTNRAKPRLPLRGRQSNSSFMLRGKCPRPLMNVWYLRSYATPVASKRTQTRSSPVPRGAVVRPSAPAEPFRDRRRCHSRTVGPRWLRQQRSVRRPLRSSTRIYPTLDQQRRQAVAPDDGRTRFAKPPQMPFRFASLAKRAARQNDPVRSAAQRARTPTAPFPICSLSQTYFRFAPKPPSIPFRRNSPPTS